MRRASAEASTVGSNNSGHTLPCAIYTRKSSEEGLEQSFNSLDAQREACEAYVLSQKAEGWTALTKAYDDGGFSGGNMDRPGLKQLMADIVAKRVRIVVVYKVDRLTRSLADFAKLVEVFDAHGVSFVSVTQQFNTTSSMGRLTLNVLLSFAQFEREVTGERIRDKIAASKAKGMWMGGIPPVGYEVKDKALVMDETSAALVRDIYETYLRLGNVRLLKADLNRRGLVTPRRTSRRQGQSGGLSFSRGHLYRILSNPVYIGKVAHRELTHEGQHPAIIDEGLWDAVQAQLTANRQGEKSRVSASEPGLLAGLVFDGDGERLTSVQSKKKAAANLDHDTSQNQSARGVASNSSRRYRYYVSQRLLQGGRDSAPEALRIPAQELEQTVLNRISNFLINESELFEVLQQQGLRDVNAVRSVLRVAAKMAQMLSPNQSTDDGAASRTTTLIELLHALVDRINVQAGSIEIVLKLSGLIEQASTATHLPATLWNGCDWQKLSHTLLLPIQLKRNGLAVRMIIESKEHQVRRSADPRMVRLLSKAHTWFNLITSGKAKSIGEISVQENLSRPHVSKIITLAFMAPDLVRAILDGKQPTELTANKLMRRLPLPIDWREQRTYLGFD